MIDGQFQILANGLDETTNENRCRQQIVAILFQSQQGFFLDFCYLMQFANGDAALQALQWARSFIRSASQPVASVVSQSS